MNALPDYVQEEKEGQNTLGNQREKKKEVGNAAKGRKQKSGTKALLHIHVRDHSTQVGKKEVDA